MRINQILFLCIIGYLIVSCTTPAVKQVVSRNYIGELDSNTVENISFDFETDCKIRIKNQHLNQAGKCKIIISKDNIFKFSLYHPLGGVVIVSYMDDKIIQYLNKSDKVFYQLENNAKNRKKIFMGAVELNVADFKEILLGRKIKALKNDIEFIRSEDLVKATKINNNNQIEIFYHKWHTVQNIQLPKLLTIKNLENGSNIKIAITKSIIGDLKKDKELSLLQECKISF